jgi:hypothetical protein
MRCFYFSRYCFIQGDWLDKFDGSESAAFGRECERAGHVVPRYAGGIRNAIGRDFFRKAALDISQRLCDRTWNFSLEHSP